MKSGLAINIPSSFSRVLSDLSFIPDVRSEDLTYTGFFGGSLSESLVNSADDAAGNMVEVVGRNPERLTFGKGFFNFIGPGSDANANGGTGIRAEVKSDNLATGFPCTLAVSFRSYKKAVKEEARRLYPLASFFTNPWGNPAVTQPALLLSATILDTGQRILSAYSGGVANSGSDALVSRCSVPIDWSATNDVISAVISRFADGTLNMAVKKGNDPILTSTYGFPVQVPNTSSIATRVLFGTSESRTLDGGDVLMGQYWHNTGMTMDEIQQQVSLIHLKAISRL